MDQQDNEQPKLTPEQIAALDAEWREGNTPELDEYLFKPVIDLATRPDVHAVSCVRLHDDVALELYTRC